MAYLVPETAKRLQATTIVRNEELNALGGATVMRLAAEQTINDAVQKMIEDCITIEDCRGVQKMVCLDVFVLSPEEFYTALAEARLQGERDAQRWMRP